MEKEKENKKTLLNTKIGEESIEKYAKIITKKALKVMACSGSIYAIELLEGKDINTLEDLQQEVALQIILDNYVINKNTFKVVRSYIYRNYEKTETELFTEETEKATEKSFYISYITEETEKKKANKIDIKKLYNILSERQKDIFKYYFINNMKQKDIADILNCKKANINNLINDIKQKAVKSLEV